MKDIEPICAYEKLVNLGLQNWSKITATPPGSRSSGGDWAIRNDYSDANRPTEEYPISVALLLKVSSSSSVHRRRLGSDLDAPRCVNGLIDIPVNFSVP